MYIHSAHCENGCFNQLQDLMDYISCSLCTYVSSLTYETTCTCPVRVLLTVKIVVFIGDKISSGKGCSTSSFDTCLIFWFLKMPIMWSRMLCSTQNFILFMLRFIYLTWASRQLLLKLQIFIFISEPSLNTKTSWTTLRVTWNFILIFFYIGLHIQKSIDASFS